MLGRTSLKREKMVVQEGMKISQYQLDIANYLLTDGNEVVTGWKLKWWWAKCLINLTVKNSLRKRTAQVTKPTAFASQRALLETQATLWALHLFVTRLQSSKDYNSPAIIQNTYTYYQYKYAALADLYRWQNTKPINTVLRHILFAALQTISTAW